MKTSAERTREWREKNPERALTKNRADANRWHWSHREEAKARMKEWALAHPDRHLRRKYGMTQADYDALFVSQGGVCAVCRSPETHYRKGVLMPLAVDHDHINGKVRGLLCVQCNRSIGGLGDNPERLEAAAAYLRRALP